MRTIPLITDERLAELAARIKPAHQHAEGLTEIDHDDLRDSSFIWDLNLGRKLGAVENLGRIQTHHTWGYYGLFKPSIAEVLAVIQSHPEADRITHFRLDRDLVQRPGEPLLVAPDDDCPDGYHRADVTLFAEVIG